MHTQTFLALAGASAIMAEPIPPHMTAAPIVAPARPVAIYPRATTTSVDSALVEECLTALDSIARDYPTPTGGLSSWFVTATQLPPTTTNAAAASSQSDRPFNEADVTSFCNINLSRMYSLSAPAEVRTAYSAYASSWVSWKSSAASAASSMAAKCLEVAPEVAGNLLFLVAPDQEKCESALYVAFGLTDDYSFVPATATTLQSTGGGSATVTGGAGGQGQGGNGGGAVGITSSSSTGGAVGPRETAYVAKMAVAALGAVVGAVAL